MTESAPRQGLLLNAAHILWVSTIVLFFILMMRGSGIYPVVFADEWSYSSYSRLLPLREAGVPSYFYLILFRVTNICGDGFLDCARILNNFFIVLTAPLIYTIARRVCSTWPAVVVALLSVAGPINTYAIYFMPEAMYFTGFWVLTWAALTLRTQSSLRFSFLLGLLLGLLSLVKIHALFLLPSLACYAVYREWRSGCRAWRQSSVVATLVIASAFIGTKLTIGYILAGRAGVTLFGSLYGAQAGTIAQKKSFIELISSVLANLSGHGMALALMFGLPLAVMLANRWRRSVTASMADELFGQDLVVYTGLVLIPLLVVVGYFTASVAGTGPYENLGRLHMRYYNFALPLFYLIAATQLNVATDVRRGGVVASVLVALVACYGLFCLLPTFAPSMVDSPELRGFSHHTDFYRLLSLAGIATTVTWAFNAKRAAEILLFAVLPVVILTSSWQVTAEVRKRQQADVYDEAGQFAKRYLGSATSQLAVIAPNPAGLLRTLFHIDNASTQTVQLEAGSTIDVATLPSSVNWLLLIGDYDIPSVAGRSLSLGSYTLVSTQKNYQLNLTQASWPGVLSRTRGLSSPEAWGTWSTGQEVMLEFAGNLPTNFRLSLDAHAFGPNEGQKFRISVGNEEHFFLLDSTPRTVSFEFTLAANERIIKFDIPKPTSPKSIGLNDDLRQLGIGISQIQITTSY